jgi:hypothetical protein
VLITGKSLSPFEKCCVYTNQNNQSACKLRSGDRAATQARQKRKLKEAGIALSEIIRDGQ